MWICISQKFETCICATKKWKCEFVSIKNLKRPSVQQKMKIWISITQKFKTYTCASEKIENVIFLPLKNLKRAFVLQPKNCICEFVYLKSLKHAFVLPKNENVNLYPSKI